MNKRSNTEYWHLIWNQFRAGDRRAFEIIYNEFTNVIYAYGSKITKDKSLLEDSIHDLFIDIYSYGKNLHNPECLEFYLFKTLKRIVIRKLKEIDRVRRSEDMANRFDLKFPIEEIEEEEQQMNERIRLLHKEVANLDTGKRELLFLKFNSGLSYAEIGKLLNTNPDTAKKKVYRLLSYLRTKIKKPVIELFVVCFKA